MTLRNKIEAQIHKQIWNLIGDQVEDRIRIQIIDNIRYQVMPKVNIIQLGIYPRNLQFVARVLK